MRKQNAELTVINQQKETSISDLSDKISSVQSIRDALERDIANLGAQLEQERGQRNHTTELISQADSKIQSLQAKVSSIDEKKILFGD